MATATVEPQLNVATASMPDVADPPAELHPINGTAKSNNVNGVNGISKTDAVNGTAKTDGAIPGSVTRAKEGLDAGPSQKETRAIQEKTDHAETAEKEQPEVLVPGKINVRCGPLLRYIGQSEDNSKWRGTVLLVTKPGNEPPEMQISCVGRHHLTNNGVGEVTNGVDSAQNQEKVKAIKIFADPNLEYWRFTLELPIQQFEAKWEYHISNLHFLPGPRKMTSEKHNFFVPAADQSMRIMFHSCNGFSVGTDEEAWSGPALWNDVLRQHVEIPFHVMVGGGDQIYNDGVRVKGPLKEWTSIHNPHRRQHYPFDQDLRARCDKFYLDNYTRWYCTEPFSTANAQIAQINIWDDHDIIDGFGSYTDHLMRSPVFLGIGSIAFKYYMLFQHHTTPPKSTFTTAVPATMSITNNGGAGVDASQAKDQFYLEEETDRSWILGAKPGPYMMQRSRSIYMRMGKRIGFVGFDARTERTRHVVNTPETYDLVFARLEKELSASKGDIKHLIVLLGVPIAYPRLVWMENILSSPLMGPLRFLNKRFGVASGFFNEFDGAVDLLDDLDDHYTARHHKKERNAFIIRLQELSRKYSVRVTILGGDVHLCAIGRFYSNPKLNIPTEHDHRYIVNLISSAITNKPPPGAVANLLARRNKIHHLGHDCDETLMKIFNKDAGNISRTANSNHVTMPSRNYAIIAESHNEDTFVSNLEWLNGNVTDHEAPENYSQFNRHRVGKTGHEALHAGEHKAGTDHAAAEGAAAGQGGVNKYGLSIALRVECDQHDREGRTEPYGFSIPALEPLKA